MKLIKHRAAAVSDYIRWRVIHSRGAHKVEDSFIESSTWTRRHDPYCAENRDRVANLLRYIRSQLRIRLADMEAGNVRP